MWGTIASAAIGTAANIYAGIKAGNIAKQMRQSIDKARQNNEAWYNRRYNEDGTQRADAQRLLSKTEEALRRNAQASAGANVVGGVTPEAQIASQQQNASTMADVAGNIMAGADARRDSIESTYMSRKDAYDQQEREMRQGQVGNLAQAAQGVAESATGIASLFDNKGKNKQ